MGKDSYMVGTSAMGGFRSKTEITQESIARANAYCEAMGKEMMSHTQDSRFRSKGMGLIRIGNSVQMSKQIDPEYQRVNMRKDPDTVVEIRK